jgi:membrane associated rhomboid family serine protease
MKVIGLLTLGWMLQSQTVGAKSTSRATFLPQRTVSAGTSQSTFHDILQVRGGAKNKRRGKSASLSSTRTATGKKKVQSGAAKEEKSTFSDSLQKYKQILPLTRIYITMVVGATLLGMILGEELTQGLLALDPMRVIYGLEMWRPFTAATFLGPPSIGWLMSGYYLFEYGSALERAYGTAQHLIFLLSQVVMLSVLSVLFGQPFFTASVITAMLHVLSRAMPNQKVKWLVFTVPYWALPYGLMATDVLQAGSPAAALPHVLGIMSGHFYHFHKFIWPKMGGEDWLTAPDFLTRRFDPNAKKDTKAAVASALKNRKRGKGRKLGGKKK